MQIKLTTLLMFLLLTFSVSAQNDESKSTEQESQSLADLKAETKKFKNKGSFQIAYDRFDDSTFIYYDGFELIGFGESFGGILAAGRKAAEPPSLTMKLYFWFESNKLTKNIDKFVLVFDSTDTEWRFLKNRELFAIADEERFKFGEGRLSDAEIKSGIQRGFSLKESVTFTVTREQLSKLAQAKSLEIRIGTREQVLKDKHRQMFKDMLSLSTLAKDKVTETK
jgi:hypothetical protein